jgi:hypothetical protein
LSESTEATQETGGEADARRRTRRRRRLVALAVVVAVLALPVRSFAVAMSAPGNMSPSEKFVEWLRDNGLNGLVNGVENWWYTSHPPKKGGVPSRRITAVTPPGASRLVRTRPVPEGIPHTPRPVDIVSPAPHPLPNEGRWIAVGPRVDGVPVMYETQVRPDAIHTSLLDGLVWMDPKLLRFELHPGLEEPGGHWSTPPDIPIAARLGLVAAFNGGFRLHDSKGGFYLDGRTTGRLVNGAASFVISKDGWATVGAWGRDVHMTPQIAAVRQNLKLIVDGGRPVAGLDDNANGAWGDTLGERVLVWRSAVCVDRHGGIVYGYGNGLGALSLAELMQRAGCWRAMELDINPSWTTFNFYGAVEAGNPASVLGAKLLPNQDKPADRYLAPDSRDFIAVFERKF